MLLKLGAASSLAVLIAISFVVRANGAEGLWNLKAYERPDGSLDVQKLQRDYEARRQRAAAPDLPKEKASVKRLSSESRVVRTSAGQTFVQPPTTSLTFLLRKDFTDVGLFSDPIDNKSADGAQFAWSRDRIANVSTWTGNATAAVAYSYLIEDIRNPFIGVTIAPYVTVNREVSTVKSQDTNVATFGISGEIGRRNYFFRNGADYLRGSGAAVEDEIARTTIAHGSLEWLPTYMWIAGSVPGTYLNYNFTPELEAQYDSTTVSHQTLLFSGKQQALRVGPEAKLWLKVVAPTGYWDFLNSLYGTISYHYWGELYSGRYNGWLDATLHYNLDPNGNIALAFSYQRGRTEDTGIDTNMYKVTLTAKTCVDVFNVKAC
jgi:hypothetical protein